MVCLCVCFGVSYIGDRRERYGWIGRVYCFGVLVHVLVLIN